MLARKMARRFARNTIKPFCLAKFCVGHTLPYVQIGAWPEVQASQVVFTATPVGRKVTVLFHGYP